MVRIKEIIKECIEGCTAHNADERRMHFNINYYVNDATGKGTKHYCFVYKVVDLEENLYNIIRDNISKDHDVVIADITIKLDNDIIRVNKNNYHYSLSGFMKWLVS